VSYEAGIDVRGEIVVAQNVLIRHLNVWLNVVRVDEVVRPEVRFLGSCVEVETIHSATIVIEQEVRREVLGVGASSQMLLDERHRRAGVRHAGRNGVRAWITVEKVVETLVFLDDDDHVLNRVG
jgi:hypothetical protein